jgi:hypothetical protein
MRAHSIPKVHCSWAFYSLAPPRWAHGAGNAAGTAPTRGTHCPKLAAVRHRRSSRLLTRVKVAGDDTPLVVSRLPYADWSRNCRNIMMLASTEKER